MHTRIFTLFSANFLALTLVGCGDNGIATGGSESSGGTTTSTTSTSTTPTTSTTVEPTTTEQTPTTTGATSTSTGQTETTGDESTTGDVSTTGDESTTGEPTDCQAPADDADEDGDGVANMADNCRCDANPNQLDFDGNAVGNVCDVPLKFSFADGDPPEVNQLETTATAKKNLDCEFGVSLIVLDSVIEVELDDDGTAKLFASRVNFADTPELTCDLGGGVIVKIRVQDFITDGVDPFVVSFPFTIADHNGGTLNGVTDSPHDILASSVINVTETPNEMFLPLGEQALMMVPGVFAVTTVTVAGNGQQISLVFDSDDAFLFETTTMDGITFKLTGLSGTLRLKK